VGLVDDEDDAAATLVHFGGEQRLGLSDQLGFLGTRTGTESVDDGQVQADPSRARKKGLC
jgi:hypothetical protein